MPFTWKFFLVVFAVLTVQSWALVVNEVYFRTTASTYRNQWIELYNEGSESVELRNFAIGTGAKRKPLLSWREGSSVKVSGAILDQTRLEAGACALILDRTYSGEEALDLPPGTPVLTVADASLGESVFLRTNDTLSLYEQFSAEYRLVESVPLPATAHGFSLERVFVDRPAERKNFSHSLLLRGKSKSAGGPNTIQGLYGDSPATRIAFKGLAGSRLTTGVPMLAELRMETDTGRVSWPAVGECAISSEGILDLVPVDAGLKALREKGFLRLPVSAGRSAAFYVLATSPGLARVEVSAFGLQKTLDLRVEEPPSALAGKIFVNEVSFKAEKAAHWLELFAGTDVEVAKLRIDFWNADLTSFRTLFYSDLAVPSGQYAILGNSYAGFSKYFRESPARMKAHADFELYTEGLVVLSEETSWGAQVIESVVYKNMTEETKPRQSLERRTTSFPARSASQWKTCSFTNGGSPGKMNSGEKKAGFEVQLKQNKFKWPSQARDEVVAVFSSEDDGTLTTELYELAGRAVTPAPRTLSILGGGSLNIPFSHFADSLRKIRGNLILQLSFSPSRGVGETRRFVIEALD